MPTRRQTIIWHNDEGLNELKNRRFAVPGVEYHYFWLWLYDQFFAAICLPISFMITALALFSKRQLRTPVVYGYTQQIYNHKKSDFVFDKITDIWFRSLLTFTPNGEREIVKQWLRWWAGAVRQQTNIWTHPASTPGNFTENVHDMLAKI